MIARQDGYIEKTDIWAKLAEPLPSSAIAWRQDGKATARDGKFFARFVCYVEAGTVRERLDAVVPGEWDLTMELLPPSPYQSEDEATVNFKATLQILGVKREDVGTGKDYKSASTDAFKRAAVRFGIGHELYAFEQNWVQVDGDSKYAKPVEDPQAAYEKKHGSGAKPNGVGVKSAHTGTGETRPAVSPEATPETAASQKGASTSAPPAASDPVGCPICGGKMWDNRLTKKNPKQPDYKCQNRSCNGVIWPPRDGKAATVASALPQNGNGDYGDFPEPLEPDEELPF